jgi:hypothetical protein
MTDFDGHDIADFQTFQMPFSSINDSTIEQFSLRFLRSGRLNQLRKSQNVQMNITEIEFAKFSMDVCE